MPDAPPPQDAPDVPQPQDVPDVIHTLYPDCGPTTKVIPGWCPGYTCTVSCSCGEDGKLSCPEDCYPSSCPPVWSPTSGTWVAEDSGVPGTLRGICGVKPKGMIAVGDEGAMTANVGNGWMAFQSTLTTETLIDVWGSSVMDIWAVGSNATVLHVAGQKWDAVDLTSTGASGALRAVHGTGPGDVWIVGDAGLVLHFDGTSWNTVNAGTSAVLNSVWAAAPNDVWVSGGQGTLIHWDGKTWGSVTPGLPAVDDTIEAVWGLGPKDVWIVGKKGLLRHWDGKTWTSFEPPVPNAWLLRVWGATTNDLWATGHDGVLLHWDGVEWLHVPIGEVAPLRGIWGSSTTDIRVLGADKRIWQYVAN